MIYYRHVSDDEIYMLVAYPKAKQDDLTPAQLRVLRQIVESGFDDG